MLASLSKLASWWDQVNALATRAHFFPRWTRLFEIEGKEAGPIPWGIWVMYIQPPTDATKTVRVLRNPEGRETQLRISERLENNHKEVVQCPALIDTGAEICVIQKGLVPEDLLRPAQRPLRLVGANERRLEGGDREVTLTLCTWGVNMGSKKKI